MNCPWIYFLFWYEPHLSNYTDGSIWGKNWITLLKLKFEMLLLKNKRQSKSSSGQAVTHSATATICSQHTLSFVGNETEVAHQDGLAKPAKHCHPQNKERKQHSVPAGNYEKEIWQRFSSVKFGFFSFCVYTVALFCSSLLIRPFCVVKFPRAALKRYQNWLCKIQGCSLLFLGINFIRLVHCCNQKSSRRLYI